MQIGMVGLGRMGANMVRRLMQHQHECVVYDRSSANVEAMEKEGATGAATLTDLVNKLAVPKAIWLMVPAGEATESTVLALGKILPQGSTIIDGGNSFYKDDVRRSAQLKEAGINEGRWTIQAALEEAVPSEVLTAALNTRFRSRQEHTFAEKMLSAMRHKFGGHVEQPVVAKTEGRK